MNSVFNELGLVGKIATSSRTSHRETPRSNKIERCKVCKGLSLLWRCDQATQSKAPLDSAAVYPITRSAKKTPWDRLKGKTIPLPCISWLILMMILYASLKRNASLDHCCLAKTHKLLPHKPLWDSFIKLHLHMSINTKWATSFKDMIFSTCLSWPCTY
jgi:hypothetical protein